MKKKRKSAKNVSEQKKKKPLRHTKVTYTEAEDPRENIHAISTARRIRKETHSSSVHISEHFFLVFFFFCYKVAHGFNSIARQYSSLVTFPENLSGHRIGFLNSSAKSHSLSWQPCTFRTSETRTNRYPTPPTNQRRANKRSAVTNLAASRQIAQELIRPMGT